MANSFPQRDNLSWDDLRVLMAVHRAGSLLAGGKALGLSTSTTSRRLHALEAALGVRLVNRSRSGTQLEPGALPFVQLAQALEHGVAARRRDGGRLTVKVSVPEGMATLATQALLALRRIHPDTDVEVAGENHLADIANREADIGLRLVRSSSSVLVEKHVATLHFALFASPGYVRERLPSRVLRPQDAPGQDFVGLVSRWRDLPHEQWMASLGAVRFPLRTSAMPALLEAVHQGVGIAALVEQGTLATGLVRLETATPGPAQSLYLVYHHELRKVAPVRAAVKLIEDHLRAAAAGR